MKNDILKTLQPFLFYLTITIIAIAFVALSSQMGCTRRAEKEFFKDVFGKGQKASLIDRMEKQNKEINRLSAENIELVNTIIPRQAQVDTLVEVINQYHKIFIQKDSVYSQKESHIDSVLRRATLISNIAFGLQAEAIERLNHNNIRLIAFLDTVRMKLSLALDKNIYPYRTKWNIDEDSLVILMNTPGFNYNINPELARIVNRLRAQLVLEIAEKDSFNVLTLMAMGEHVPDSDSLKVKKVMARYRRELPDKKKEK